MRLMGTLLAAAVVLIASSDNLAVTASKTTTKKDGLYADLYRVQDGAVTDKMRVPLGDVDQYQKSDFKQLKKKLGTSEEERAAHGLPLKAAIEVLDEYVRDVLREYSASDVRRHDHLRVGPQRAVLRQGLLLEHVQHGLRQQPLFQRVYDSLLRDHIAATNVDENRLLLAAHLERVLGQQVASRVSAGQYIHHVVALLQHFTQVIRHAISTRGQGLPVLITNTTLEPDYLEPRSLKRAPDLLANVAEPEDADRQLPERAVLQLPASELALLLVLLRLEQLALDGNDVAEHELRQRRGHDPART
ncbi:hypothetical protein ON010_g16826 [Phytophthora cinnamomi]|nr:hypothetical protein ON010_g16826 [Phytophthora cinnamomi]